MKMMHVSTISFILVDGRAAHTGHRSRIMVAIVTVQKKNIAHWYRCTDAKIPTDTHKHKHTHIAIPKAATHYFKYFQ